MPTKVFTLQEANKRLPLVRKIVEDILQKGQHLKALQLLNQTPLVHQQCQNLITQIEALISELEDLGCYFKDWNFEIGLVDFPAQINGENILFCWKSDEPDIRWYHNFLDGYHGRALIPQDLLL